MLEWSIATVISHTQKREDISSSVVVVLLDVVILEIDKLFVLDDPIRDERVENSSVGSHCVVLFAILG